MAWLARSKIFGSSKTFFPLRNVAKAPLSVTSFSVLYVQISLIASFGSYAEIY